MPGRGQVKVMDGKLGILMEEKSHSVGEICVGIFNEWNNFIMNNLVNHGYYNKNFFKKFKVLDAI